MSVQKDCYYFVDDKLPEEERIMQAMCAECHKTHNLGWFWKGSELGYGDFDLMCSICKKEGRLEYIHQRENDICEET